MFVCIYIDIALEIAGLVGSTVEPIVKSELTYQKHVNFTDIYRNYRARNQQNGQNRQDVVANNTNNESHFSVPPNVPGLIWSFCLNYGLIIPTSGLFSGLNSPIEPSKSHENQPIDPVHIIDRYYLGGPSSLRGFDYFGVDKQSTTPLPYNTIDTKQSQSNTKPKPSGNNSNSNTTNILKHDINLACDAKFHMKPVPIDTLGEPNIWDKEPGEFEAVGLFIPCPNEPILQNSIPLISFFASSVIGMGNDNVLSSVHFDKPPNALPT